jgi:ABC-2 type transport system permease protein
MSETVRYLLHLGKVEFGRALRERGIRGLVFVMALLAMAALSQGLAERGRLAANIAHAVDDDGRRLAALELGLKQIEGGARPPRFADPTQAGRIGLNLGVGHAVKPVEPWAALALGASDLQSHTLRVSSGNKDQFLYQQELRNPDQLAIGTFDLAFVIAVVMPLGLLALVADALARERESGTFRLAMSQGVGEDLLVVVKVVPVAAAVGICTCAIFTLASLLAAGMPDGPALARLGAASALILAYTAFWTALAVGALLFARSLAGAAMPLVAAWTVLVFVAPGLLLAAAKLAHPVPSRMDLLHEVREQTVFAEGRYADLLARHFHDHPQLAEGGMNKVDVPAFLMQATVVQQEVSRRVDPLYRRHRAATEAREAAVGAWALFAPAAYLQDALADLAGTGTERHRRFIGQVDAFHDEWRGYFFPRVLARERFSSASLPEVPRFRFEPEPQSELLLRSAVRVAQLAALSGGLGMAIWMLTLFLRRRAHRRPGPHHSPLSRSQ